MSDNKHIRFQQFSGPPMRSIPLPEPPPGARHSITNPAMFYEFFIDIEPQPKERPNKWGKTPPKTKAFQDIVAKTIREQWGSNPPIPKDVYLTARFLIYQRKRKGDYDNLMKPITDAMNEIVFADDKQIDECYFKREVGRHDHIHIQLWRVDW